MNRVPTLEIAKLVIVSAMLGGRLESLLDGVPHSWFFACLWALWVISIAYNMWAIGRIEGA